MKIILILRSRLKGGRSIEGIFESLQNYLSRQIDIASWEYDSGKSLIANLRSIKLQNATIIHITSDLYYLLLFLRKKNAIITIHDIGRYKELTGWKKIVLGNVWIKWPATLAKKITTVSHYTEQDLRKHFPDG